VALYSYILKKQIIVGILQINSEVFYQESRVWEDTIFPVRFDVKIIIKVPNDKGIPVTKMFDKLSLLKNVNNKKRWGVFFMNSFNEFTEKDGDLILDELEEMLR